MFDYESSDFRMDNSEGVISEFYLYVSLDTQLIMRRYQKIQTVLANFGGIANFLFICGYILLSSYQEFSLTKMVMNKIYTFSDTRKSRKQGKNKTKSPLTFIKETPQNDDVNKQSNALKSSELLILSHEKAKIDIKKHDTQPMDISSNLNIIPHPFSEIKNFPYPPPKACPEQNEDDLKQESEEFEKDSSISPTNLKNELNNKVNSFVDITPLPDLTGDSNKLKKINKSKFSKKFIKTTDFDSKFKEFEKHKKKENKLDLSFGGFIYGFLKTLFKKEPSPSFKLFSKAKQIFVEEIDLLEILVKIKEFEKFKSILLSEEQLKLFHAIGKPLISVNENEEEDSSQLRMSKLILESKKVNENEIWNIYKKLKMQTDNSEINIRLLSLLDEKIKEYKVMNELQEKEMMDS